MKKQLQLLFCLGFITLANAQSPNYHFTLDSDFYEEISMTVKPHIFKAPADDSGPFDPVFDATDDAPLPGANYGTMDYSDVGLITNQYYVEIDAMTVLPGLTKLTYSFWFKSTVETTGGGSGAVILGQNTTALAFLWNSELIFRIGTDNNGYYDAGGASVGINQNQWYYCTMVYDGDGAQNTKIYLDGVLAATSSVSITGGLIASTQGFALGNPWGQFLGKIDEFKIWTGEALSAAQILEHYQTGILAVDDYAFGSHFRMYPNPTTSILNIGGGTIVRANISISNLLGQKLREVSDANSISVEGLNKGLYLVTVESEGKQVTRKIVVE